MTNEEINVASREISQLMEDVRERDDKIEQLKLIMVRLIDWIEEDYRTGEWDHNAPGKLLIKQAQEAVL